jgi:enoyl-CoA hydratase/carnithine racemase
MSETVRVAINGGLARITLDRPPVNVLTTAMMNDLAAGLRRAATDESVRVVGSTPPGRRSRRVWTSATIWATSCRR